MAKKQTRRSISVSRTTYERLKAFCETNNISMSQFVETRVGDFLGEGVVITNVTPTAPRPAAPTPMPARPMPMPPPIKSESRPALTPTFPQPHAHSAHSAYSTHVPSSSSSSSAAPALPVPMTSAAARYAVEPPPPVIKPKQETAAPKPAEKRADQIFTF